MAKTVWRILWGLLKIVLQIAVFFAPLVGLVILLDKTTPSHWFPFPVPLLIILWLVISAVFLRRIIRYLKTSRARNRITQDHPERNRPNWRGLAVYLASIFIIMGSAFAVMHIISDKNAVINQDLLVDSKQHFIIHLDGYISQECSDRNQIELERALQNLMNKLEPVAPPPIIEVHIYPNAKEYHQKTGAPDKVAAFSICPSTGPVIFLPTVNCGDKSSYGDTNSPVFHEMVHAYVCALVGSDKNESMPKWFREGLAYFEDNKAWWKVLNRIRLRGWLWWDGDNIMDQNSLNSYVLSSSPNKEEDTVFNLCSFEFMRYTVSASTADAPWAIISKVRDGETFEKAFEDTIGTRWEDLYSKWLRSF